MKKKIIPIIITILCITIILGIYIFQNKKKDLTNYEELSNYTTKYNAFLITNYEEYLENKEIISSLKIVGQISAEETEIKKELEKGKKYLFLTINMNSCGENINIDYVEKNKNILNVYLTDTYSCGVCAMEELTYIYELDSSYSDIKEIKPFVNVIRKRCDSNVVYKPIIYIYPNEDIDLEITLENMAALTYTYPKYKNKWQLHVSKNSNIYDYNTKRNYYALYWEGIDNTIIDTTTGFVIPGDKTISFLEEKLELLGLNEYEINEFIIYWIDKLENNPYNYIHFRTTEEINNYMPLHFSKEPDTLIRIMMDYAPLNEYITVKEQKLLEQNRSGFTIVEWGGRKINLN